MEATRSTLFRDGSEEELAEPVSAEGRGRMDLRGGFRREMSDRVLEMMGIKGDGLEGTRASLELELTASLLQVSLSQLISSHPFLLSSRHHALPRSVLVVVRSAGAMIYLS